jgi:hypothetical protein
MSLIFARMSGSSGDRISEKSAFAAFEVASGAGRAGRKSCFLDEDSRDFCGRVRLLFPIVYSPRLGCYRHAGTANSLLNGDKPCAN